MTNTNYELKLKINENENKIMASPLEALPPELQTSTTKSLNAFNTRIQELPGSNQQTLYYPTLSNIIDRKSYLTNKIIILTFLFKNKPRDDKIKIVSEILDCLTENSDIIFNNYKDYICFIVILKKKLFELKKHKELKYKCENFIDIYYNKQCRAFTLKNERCGNKISRNVSKDFCKTHNIKYISKIVNIINKELPIDIARLCTNPLFYRNI